MSEELHPELLERHHKELKQHFKRNFFAHGVEGGLFMGGIAFTAPATVLPVIVESLNGPSLIVGLAPTMLLVGFMLPGVFVAHRIERLAVMRPFVLKIGVLQRLPYLLAGAALLLAPGMPTWLALMTVALCPLIAGFIGGINVPAWFEFVAKTIPEERRASLWAVRHLVAALIGIGAGFGIKAVLEAWPGVPGYGVLHLLVFVFLVGSFFVLAMARETTVLPPKKRGPQEKWYDLAIRIPAMLREDSRLARYILSRVLYSGIFIMIPLLGIHALQRLQREESFLGELVSMQNVGMIAGIGLSSWLGDRFGGKLLMVIGGLAMALVAAGSVLAAEVWHFMAVFGLFGLSMSMTNVATPILNLEISPIQRRVAYTAVIGWFTLAGTLAVTVLFALARDMEAPFEIFAGTALVMILVSLAYLKGVQEPRRRKANA